MKRLLIISALLFSTGAFAQNFYAGVAFGQTTAKDACAGLAGTGISCDDSDSAWRVFGGYQFNRNFAAELGYIDLGEVTASFGSFRETASATAFELVGVGMLPVSERFSVYAKLGLYRAETNDRTNFGFSASAKNNDLTFGFGARYDFTGNFAVRGEWQRYVDVGGGEIGKADVDVISIGALVKF